MFGKKMRTTYSILYSSVSTLG